MRLICAIGIGILVPVALICCSPICVLIAIGLFVVMCIPSKGYYSTPEAKAQDKKQRQYEEDWGIIDYTEKD